MLQDIQSLKEIITNDFATVTNAESLETFRLKHLVQKGTLRALTDRLREVPKEEKPLVGKSLNELRSYVEQEFVRLKEEFESTNTTESIDVTLSGRTPSVGSLHPIRQTLDSMIDIFTKMGFDVAEGPDIEDDYHNFGALNFAPDHPARDMQDTFFVKPENGIPEKTLLRTHTSPVQVRLMKSSAPPIRAIMPGRVYRNEAISARSLAEFHQLEGLYINKNVSFAELKGTMVTFAKLMYGSSINYRFRASYFPFTEPSAEMDITCFLCGGKGCRVCKYSGWLEVVGCGMVHPNVLTECGINPDEYSGYAFGFGIERVTMLRTGIDDIRLLYENDVRVLRQL
jgi:phenylalanyl-tRNA synthetase alpha chain